MCTYYEKVKNDTSVNEIINFPARFYITNAHFYCNIPKRVVFFVFICLPTNSSEYDLCTFRCPENFISVEFVICSAMHDRQGWSTPYTMHASQWLENNHQFSSTSSLLTECADNKRKVIEKQVHSTFPWVNAYG